MKQSIDSTAVEIWQTYAVLAQIAEQEGKASEARVFHQQARKIWASELGRIDDRPRYPAGHRRPGEFGGAADRPGATKIL
jgi:putative alpha-1,2-mannosidase